MTVGVLALEEAHTAEEKRAVLENTHPKIVDAEKYHGPVVTDFAAIAKRAKEIVE